MEIYNNVGEKVKLILSNGYVYVGVILSKGETYVKIRDKYDKTVFLSLDNVKVVEEVE